MLTAKTRRILVVDDNRAIHADFRKILTSSSGDTSSLDQVETALFDVAGAKTALPVYEVGSAYQGQEGVDMVRAALERGAPYAVAFVDMRMPPGLDGAQTVTKLWEVDPELQVVICTAYTDYSWEEILVNLGATDRLLVLKKPFDNAEVRQLACALTEKWHLARNARLKLTELRDMVDAEIRKSEEQFRGFFENSPIGKAIVAISGRMERVNRALCKLLCYTADELCSGSWAGITHPDDMAMSIAALNSLLSGEQSSARIEKRYLTKEGNLVWAVVSITPLIDHEGKMNQFIAYFIDISKRKRAEQLLSRSEQTLRRLVEGLKDAYFFFSREGSGKIDQVSPSITTVLGYSPEEFRDHSDEYDTDNVVNASHAKLCLSGVKQATYSREILHKDGTAHWLEVVELPVLESGKVVAVEGIAHDVTRRRRLEVELNHARKLEAIGQLAAGIAHEINTPMQYVGDNLTFLNEAFGDILSLVPAYRDMMQALGEDSRHRARRTEIEQREGEIALEELMVDVPKAFQGCFDGVQRASGIIRAMKEFAHPDGSNKQLADLNRALETTLMIARNECKYVADVETDLGEIPPILCHASDLNQVFLNLIVNAAQAITEVVDGTSGRGKIRVSSRRDGDTLCIDIADTGAGIPEPIRERVFDPFFTTKAVGKGSGQGLAISRSIVVEKHGGSLTFDTTVGKGTTFKIRLPIGGQSVRFLQSGGNERSVSG